jgi:hypothetical protein
MYERYEDYRLETMCSRLCNGRYSICVQISKKYEDSIKTAVFNESDTLACILLQESEKESIRLGMNMVDRNMVGF